MTSPYSPFEDNCTFKFYVAKSRNKKSGYKKLNCDEHFSMDNYRPSDRVTFLPDVIHYKWANLCRVLILLGKRGKLTKTYNNKVIQTLYFE